MRAQVSFLAVVGLATHRKVSAQQLPFYQYPYDGIGLSTECVAALDTIVECSDFLGRHAGKVFVLPVHAPPIQTSPTFTRKTLTFLLVVSLYFIFWTRRNFR